MAGWRRWATLAVLAAGAGLAGTARADMVYFKNGASLWGQEVQVEGDVVVVTRPGVTLRFRMADVERIEQKSTNMPQYRVDVPPPIAPGPSAPVVPGGSPEPGAPGAAPGAGITEPPPPGPPAPGEPQGLIPIPGAAPPAPPR